MGDTRATRFRLGKREYIALSFPLHARLPHSLTSVECEIASSLLTGHTNAAIAARRGTSVRTVENQVTAIFRKLRISSRGQLAGRLRELEDDAMKM